MTFWDNTTIQTLENGSIVLVGEEHGNWYSKQLMDRVIDEVQPGTIAIEMPPGRRPSLSGGMGHALEHGMNENIPVITIDKERQDLRGAASGNYTKLVHDANIFTHPIKENGDVKTRSITEARTRVKDKHGIEAHKEMYTRREKEMARNLGAAAETYSTPIVAAVGTFHILALRDIYPHVNRGEIEDRQILGNTNDES